MTQPTIFSDLLSRVQQALALLPLTEDDRYAFQEALVTALYANFTQQLMYKVKAGGLSGPEIEVIKNAKIGNLPELNQAMTTVMEKLSADEKGVFARQILMSSGEIVGSAMRPLIEITDDDLKVKVFRILQIDEAAVK